MHDGFKPPQTGVVAEHHGGQAGPVDPAVDDAAREGCVECGHRRAGVELVDHRVGILHGDTQFPE